MMGKRILVFLLCLLFSQALGFFVKPAFAAQTHDLSASTSYNIRIDGAVANDQFAFETLAVADINRNGKPDILICATFTGYNSRVKSGSLYVIFDSIYNYSGTGNTIDLANPANYNLRFDGANANDYFCDETLATADLDNDGKLDILAGARNTDYNSRTDSGSLYIFYNTLIDNYSGTGNNIDLANSANYSLRLDGAAAGDFFSLSNLVIADLNSDGKQDILVGGIQADNNSRSNSGSLYLIYNTLFNSYSGKNIDMATASNYNLRYDGAASGNMLGYDSVLVADLNNNNKPDILVGGGEIGNNARSYSGSLYVIYDDLIDNYPGIGNAIDLATPANYNLRVDGAAAIDELSFGSTTSVADINNNNRADLLVGAMWADNNSRTNSGSLYIISDDIIDNYSETGHSLDLAVSTNYYARYDGAAANDSLTYLGVRTVDFFGTGKKDLLLPAIYADNNGRTDSGSVYIINNTLINSYSGVGNNIDMANSANYSLRYDSAAAGNRLANLKFTLTDIDGDGTIDLILSSYNADHNSRTDSGSLYIIYNFPHTITATAVSAYTTSDALSVTGTVAVSSSSTTALSGVQYSLDSNSPSLSGWTACSGTSSFICSLAGLSEGGHTVYLRAYDVNTSYTAASAYSSVSFIYDKTAPLTSWTSNDNASRTFSSPQTNVFSTSLYLPSFSFTKSKDTTAGIAKYQILIKKEKQPDGSGNQYYTYIDDISHDPSGAGVGTILDETNRYIKYSGDDIFVYSKRIQDALPNGGYKWKVRVLDKAGNQTDTQEKILLINTHSANFSGTWFPLVLLSKSPSFYGITTVGSIVTLTLKQNNQTIFTKTTTANVESRFGINITKTDNLKSGTYTVLLSAANQHGDYIELPEFKYTYGKKTLPAAVGAKTVKPIPTVTPIPAQPPQPTPEPTAKPKRCLLFWCW